MPLRSGARRRCTWSPTAPTSTCRSPGRRSTPDIRLHRRSSLRGFDDPEIRAGAAAALEAAGWTLREDPDRVRLGPLCEMLHARVTPAHTIVKAYRQGRPIGDALRVVG